MLDPIRLRKSSLAKGRMTRVCASEHSEVFAGARPRVNAIRTFRWHSWRHDDDIDPSGPSRARRPRSYAHPRGCSTDRHNAGRYGLFGFPQETTQ